MFFLNKILLAIIVLGIAFIYIILPVDFIPEIIFGPIGYIDDIIAFIGAIWFLLK